MKLRTAVYHLGFFYSGGGEKLVLEEVKGLRALGHGLTRFAPIVDKESCFPELMADIDVRPILPQAPRLLPIRDIVWIVLTCMLIPFLAAKFRSYDVFFGGSQPGLWLVSERVL